MYPSVVTATYSGWLLKLGGPPLGLNFVYVVGLIFSSWVTGELDGPACFLYCFGSLMILHHILCCYTWVGMTWGFLRGKPLSYLGVMLISF